MRVMEDWGNERGRKFYENRVPRDMYIPDENDSVQTLERWIRDKYDRRKFVPLDNHDDEENGSSSRARKPKKKSTKSRSDDQPSERTERTAKKSSSSKREGSRRQQSECAVCWAERSKTPSYCLQHPSYRATAAPLTEPRINCMCSCT